MNNKMENNKISKLKKKHDDIFKTSLFILASMIIFFVIISFVLIFTKGISGFFQYDELNISDFLFGNYYDGIAYFAAGFMVVNTVWLSLIALLIAVPISLFTAIFITKVVPKEYRGFFYSIIAILAAIPSVIYGAFAKAALDSAVTAIFGIPPGSALTVVIMLAFMIMPTITILTITSINSVNTKMEDSSLALGATRTQTSFYVTLRASSKGIIVASLLGLGRAIGEATAVSMVASQPNGGPTFGLFENIRLLTSTMLQGFIEIAPDTLQEASLYAMSILLILTIAIIFVVMRYLEKSLDEDLKSKKASEKLDINRGLIKKINDTGLESLTNIEQKQYVKYRLEKENSIEKYQKQKQKKQEVNIKANNLFASSGAKYKKKITRRYSISTLIFSMIGLLLLVSIIIFLLIGGTQALSWDYLTTSGVFQTITFDNGESVVLYGLSTAIFGTIFTIVLTLIIAIPIGVLIAFYFTLYSNPESRFGKIFSFFITILTGIPSLIFGIIAIIVFIPIANAIGMSSLAGALIMSIVVLPVVIKTTQEAILSINKNQEQGSLSLGATKFITSRKVILVQITPAIISASILSIGRVMGESAIFIVIYGTASSQNASEWISNGGTTLATEIYKLTLLETIPWDYVKAIGIIIVALIFAISLLSHYIDKRKKIEGITFGFALILIFLSIFIAQFWLFIFALILAFLAIIFKPIYNKICKIKKSNKSNNFIKNFFYDLRIKFKW
ncbi:MAG: hypothetical protein HPAVJP_2040 [Candidatus Hepatoplasma vulgare]|nr:MAG: hypothetical protein HPAVJP_2040 [Candidatus Hepatoplasma sp.]